jgi:predicted dehydrogenase
LKVLQFGAGSMGSRRLRDLSAHAEVEVALVEARADRAARARERFGVRVFADAQEGYGWGPGAVSISVPPDAHEEVVQEARRRGLPWFCEAAIWTPAGWETPEMQKMGSPSSSLVYLPMVEELRRVVREELGTLHAYQMMLSVNAPGWHPEEGVEYYARRRATSAGREMVPFELGWLSEVFSPAMRVNGRVLRRGDLPGMTEDVWLLQMDLENGAAGQLTVEQVSPAVVRAGSATGANGAVMFDLLTGVLKRDFPGKGMKDERGFGAIKDVAEPMYKREIGAFVERVLRGGDWRFGYGLCAKVTGTLAAMEASAESGAWAKVDAGVQPGR